MAEVFYFHVQEDRSIKYKLPEPIMQEDKDVATWRFRIPKVLNNIDMSAWAWWFVYVNAKGQKFSELLTLTNDIDDPENYCTADYSIGYGISKTPGGFTFALEAINTSQGGEISGEWHTRTYTHTVTPTLQGNQAEYAETESDVISALMQEVRNKVNQLVGGATPLPVNLKSLMTDHGKVYLYTGSEDGESTGYWYYYNGTQFVPGGLYGAGIQIDSTLSQSGQAADAKAVGDEISDLKEDLETNFHINGNVKPNLVVGSFVNATNNHIDQSNNFSMTEPIAVKKGQKVTLTARGYNAVVGMIATCNADNTSRTTVVKSIDSSEHDYIYNVPEDGYIVCSFDNRHEYKIAISIDYYSLFEDMDTLNIINAGTDSVPIVVKSTGFINATNNKYAESNNFYLSESVHLYKDQTVSLTATGYNTVVGMINLYDSESDAYETVVASTDSSEHTYSYTATKECDVRFSYEKYKSATASITTSETTSVRLDSIESDIADLQNSISAPVEYPQLFTNVICIGDSLTYGHDGQTRLETNYPFYFGKLANVTVSNQGLSGRTTKQWWDELGSTYTHFADFDCAIIYLGTNGGLTDTIETDCNTSDYTQNADTNTGCYGKIIGKIKADAPNCKIFCVAGPSEYLNRDSTMNPAVRHLASFYDVGLIDLSGCMIDDNGTTSSVERHLYRPIDGIHYNRLGYMTLANMIYDYMKVYIKNHLSKYVS